MTEKRRFLFWVIVLGLFSGGIIFSAQADLGLKDLVDEGGEAIRSAVTVAVKSIFNSTDDPAEIEAKLVAILNEAALTGNEKIVRDTIIAVMSGGGAEFLALGKSAIETSNIGEKYSGITGITVAMCEKLIVSSAALAEVSSGNSKVAALSAQGLSGMSDELGGGISGGGTDGSSGGGFDNPFDDGGGDIDDGDVAATQT